MERRRGGGGEEVAMPLVHMMAGRHFAKMNVVTCIACGKSRALQGVTGMANIRGRLDCFKLASFFSFLNPQ